MPVYSKSRVRSRSSRYVVHRSQSVRQHGQTAEDEVIMIGIMQVPLSTLNAVRDLL